MRKSITTRYFYSTAILLLCSIAEMGFVQLYLSMGYFRASNNEVLLGTIFNTARIFHESKLKDTYEQNDPAAASTVAREILITARASGNLIFVTDPYGTTLLCNDGINSAYQGKQFPEKALNIAFNQGAYTELGTLNGFFATRFYAAGKPLLAESGKLIGFIFAATDATGLGEYISNMFSTFILSAGLMLMVSSVLSIVLTARMTTPLRRIAEAAKRFGNSDFSSRVPVEGDDELAQLAVTFNNMASSLEKIDSSRRSFMGNIAHELRTPMTSIKGFIDGMLDGTIPPESHEHYLGIVSQEVGRLTRLIKNMLDITKLEAGEYKVNAGNYDVWETITGVVFGAEQRLEANHIQISGFAPVKTMVYADADLVYQVLQNLMDNAIKFCNEDGEIRFSVTQSKGVVTVGIRNTGVGIAEDALPFVFDRFYKEDKSRGLNTTGSGLGLHICKVLINLSDGNLWVTSKEGEYCEFLFTLPAEKKKPAEPSGTVKQDAP
ncbi:MAG: HAMP domain-containing sensor histidine kinase [Ruthenibacterium sp.]